MCLLSYEPSCDISNKFNAKNVHHQNEQMEIKFFGPRLKKSNKQNK